MITKLAHYRDRILLFKGTGEMLQVSVGDARKFLLNYLDEEYGANSSADLGLGAMPDFAGDVIAEVSPDGCLIVRNAQKFKEIILKGEIDFMSVTEYADEHGKSTAYIRRLCQKGLMPGTIQKGKVYLIPRNTKCP